MSQIPVVKFTLLAATFVSPWFRGTLYAPMTMTIPSDDPLVKCFESGPFKAERSELPTRPDVEAIQSYFSDVAMKYRADRLKKLEEAEAEPGAEVVTEQRPPADPPAESSGPEAPAETPDADQDIEDPVIAQLDHIPVSDLVAHGLPTDIVPLLQAAGHDNVGSVMKLGADKLTSIPGIADARADKIDKAIQVCMASLVNPGD